MRVDLLKATPSEFARLLAQVAKLGAADETCDAVAPTGAQLAARFACAWRKGHTQALRQAYMAGRFHVRTMGLD